MSDRSTDERLYLRRVSTGVAIFIASLLFLAFIYFVSDVLLLIFAAALVAIFLRGLADLTKPYFKIGDGWRVLIVTTGLLTFIAIGIALLSPSVAEQGKLLRTKIPESAQKASEFLSQYSWGRTIIDNILHPEDLLNSVNVSVADVVSNVSGYFSSTVGVIGNIAIIALLGLYFASEPRLYSNGIVKLFPKDRRVRAEEVVHATYETLRWWLIGKFASMLFIGILTWIGLSILGVPLALTLGLIAGLLSFIPNFGPIISAIPALLLAFIDSPISALYVLGLYVGIQVVESNIVTPLIERETVELPPALTVVFQIVLGGMTGGLGLILATPLLAMFVVLVKKVYIEDILGDKTELAAAEAD